MIAMETFAKGMVLLGTAFNRKLSEDVIRLYHQVVGPKLTDEQFEVAVRRVLEVERAFPAPAVLLRHGDAGRPAAALGAAVYDQILQNYECGVQPGPREVRERWGEAAMDAFVAAGGTRAFSWCEPRDLPFRRKAFLEAWVESTASELAALPPGTSAQALLESGSPAPKAGL